jgi:serine/threonine protein phosphatase PrpC
VLKNARMGDLVLLSHKAWAKSDIGKKRVNNEDSYFMDDRMGLFMVADGMGGHRGGARASSLAIESAAFAYKEQSIKKGLKPNIALECAMNAAAKSVFDAGHSEEKNLGMGTTLSMLVIGQDTAYIAHIGDTRIYLLRENNLLQLTRDHSLVSEQVQAGILTQDEARVSPFRNIITRALGQNTKINADYSSITIENKDIFLLCSDGLTSMVKEDVIVDIIDSDTCLDSVVQKLIDEANINGGDDNITAILIQLYSK